MAKRNIESLSPEIKISQNYYLKDVLIAALIIGVLMLLLPVVYTPLQPFYAVFAVIVALVAIKRNKKNPGKRMFEIILIALNRDQVTYHMIEKESIVYEERKKESLTNR